MVGPGIFVVVEDIVVVVGLWWLRACLCEPNACALVSHIWVSWVFVLVEDILV